MLEQLQGRLANFGVLSSFSWIFVAICMQSRQDEWTAAMSIRALKESDGPSYFHLHMQTKNEIYFNVYNKIITGAIIMAARWSFTTAVANVTNRQYSSF